MLFVTGPSLSTSTTMSGKADTEHAVGGDQSNSQTHTTADGKPDRRYKEHGVRFLLCQA
jgi:hypothetical protein